MIKLKGELKDFVIDNVDLIRGVLYVLGYENTPSQVIKCLTLLEHCFYLNSTKLTRNQLQLEYFEEHPAFSISFKWLEYFFCCDGESILLSLRDTYSKNHDIVHRISCIE